MEVVANKLQHLLEEDVLELRGDGRAGSGLVLTMQCVAAVAVMDPALHVQEWPFFSSARKGAPTRSFLRVGRKPILKGSEITKPQISIMMDEGVSQMVDFAQGVPRGGIFVLNSTLSPEEAAKKFHLSGRVYTIDGDKISEAFLKKPLGNISIFALLMEILPGFEPAQALQRLAEILKKRRLPDSLIQANCNLFEASLGKARFVDADYATAADHAVMPFGGWGELMPGAQSRLRLSRTNLTSTYARTGYKLSFNDPENLCNGCSHCIINCPENIIYFKPDAENGVRVTGADVSNYCKLCRECITICPKQLFTEVPIHEG